MAESARSATFVITDEDHTLGNMIRYCLINDPDVSFAGYTIPHPAENKLDLRVQSDTKPAIECVVKAATFMSQIAGALTDALHNATRASV